MNQTTRFFNGTRDGENYQARVTRIGKPDNQSFEVDVVIFSRATGEPFYSFVRHVSDTDSGMRAAVRAVIANPDKF